MTHSVTQRALRAGTRRAVDQATDYGALLVLDQKKPKGQRRAEKVSRPDPSNPNREIMGCRRVEEFRRMHEAGTIRLEHFLACERYIVTASAAMGVHDQDRSPVGRRPPWQQGHVADQQLAAMVSMRNAANALGNSAHAMVQMLVLENLNVSAIAERLHMDRKEAKGTLIAALTRLAEHWGFLTIPVAPWAKNC